MRTLHLTGLALAISAGMALPLAGSAQAAMGGALSSTQVLPVEQAQFFFLGHNFCWYDDGWQGPGWYWCGYAWNNGYGWGGGEGWHGWSRGQWHGNRGPVGHAPYQAPQNNIVRTPQLKGGAFPHGVAPTGAGPKGGAGPGVPPCPQGKC
ncbi:MAG: hypothetical protein ABSF67_18320 [Roseiarcus sp.]|jgi:hypothetical protein